MQRRAAQYDPRVLGHSPFRGAALRHAREKAGLTQHQLAHRIGVAGEERVSRWELGTSTPQPATLSRLAKALGIRMADLLDDADGPADLRVLRLEAGFSSPGDCASCAAGGSDLYSVGGGGFQQDAGGCGSDTVGRRARRAPGGTSRRIERVASPAEVK